MSTKRRLATIPNRFEHRNDGTTAIFIERRNGQLFECMIDTQDYNLVRNYRWCVEKSKNRHRFYAVASGYSGTHKTTIRMHRLLLPTEEVDHQDLNGLNNKRSNLRPASGSTNCANRRKWSDSTNYKGVDWVR